MMCLRKIKQLCVAKVSDSWGDVMRDETGKTVWGQSMKSSKPLPEQVCTSVF